MVGDPAYGRGLELDDRYGTFQPRPFYDDSVMMLFRCVAQPELTAYSFVLTDWGASSESTVWEMHVVSVFCVKICLSCRISGAET